MSFSTLGHQLHNFAILLNIFCSLLFCKILQYFSIFFRLSISDLEQIFGRCEEWSCDWKIVSIFSRTLLGMVVVDICTPLWKNNSSRSKAPDFS